MRVYNNLKLKFFCIKLILVWKNISPTPYGLIWTQELTQLIIINFIRRNVSIYFTTAIKGDGGECCGWGCLPAYCNNRDFKTLPSSQAHEIPLRYWRTSEKEERLLFQLLYSYTQILSNNKFKHLLKFITITILSVLSFISGTTKTKTVDHLLGPVL